MYNSLIIQSHPEAGPSHILLVLMHCAYVACESLYKAFALIAFIISVR